MRKLCLFVFGTVFAVLGVCMAASLAEAAQATELWMLSAEAGQPDDAEAEASYVGRMATGRVCSAMAEAMTAHMQEDTSRRVVAFECRVRVIRVEAN